MLWATLSASCLALRRSEQVQTLQRASFVQLLRRGHIPQAQAAAGGAAVGAAAAFSWQCSASYFAGKEEEEMSRQRLMMCAAVFVRFFGSQLANDDDGGTTRTGQGPDSGMHSAHTDTLLALPPLLVACIYIIVGRGQFFCPQ